MSTTTLHRPSAAASLHVGAPGTAAAAEVSALLNAALGAGFITPGQVAAMTGGSSGVAVRARGRRGNLLGAATARVLTAVQAEALQASLCAAGAPGQVLSGHRIGELKSSAVAPDARGRGIGTQMLQARLAFLRSGGCRYAVAASWISADAGHASQRILERAGFTQLATIPGYWAADQAAAGYTCHDCGQSCTCTAAIMILDLR